MKLNEILDNLGNHLNRIKTIGMLVLFGLLVFSFIQGGCDRRRAEDMVERVTGLNVQNDILREDVKLKDSLVDAKNKRIKELEDSIYLSKVKFSSLQAKYGNLKGKLEHISDSLIKIPADSSYSFLIHKAYPYRGKMEFPFNAPQVKSIQITYLENKSLLGMNNNLVSQVQELQGLISLKDEVLTQKSAQMELMGSSRYDVEKIIQNKDEEIKIKDKQLKKEKNRKRFSQYISGAIILVLTILAVGS